MAPNFKELRAKMSPESRAKSEAMAREMLASMPLDELRAARHLTQEHLAALLGIKQASISKMERRTDMYIGTLSKFIEAMGGTSRSAPASRMALYVLISSPTRRKSTRHEVVPVNPQIITTIATAAGLLIALWTMASNFDRRDQGRFDFLQKLIESTRGELQKQIDSTKEVLRAEMKEMRAETRLEIREAGDRRLLGK